MRRWAKLMLVNDSFTVCVTSWRCSSTSSCAWSASRRAASVDANVLPKSKMICESETRMVVFSDGSRIDDDVCAAPGVTITDVPETRKVEAPLLEALFVRAKVADPVSCGSSGEKAWSTR